jgi:hypothetical protein
MSECADLVQNLGQVPEEYPFADINAEGDILYLTALLVTEFDERGKESRRQIIDTKVPGVLERLERMAFA